MTDTAEDIRPLTNPHSKWGVVIGTALLAAAIVGVVVLAFLWPVVTASAKDLPVGITGPSAAVSAISDAIDENAEGAIDLITLDDEDAARTAIEHREIYGAIVAGQTPTVLVSSAASTPVSQLLTGIAAQLQAAVAAQVSAAGGDPSSVKVAVEDVVPLSADDPSGIKLNAASFPIVLGGLIGGVLISLRIVGVVRRLVALVVYGLLAGTGLTLVLQTWFGILQGDFLPTAAALGLAMLATGAVITGFNALIGAPGVAVGAVITMFIGNPISGAALPHQFLVAPWGDIGQYFVPGAAASLVRGLSYFPDADASMQWLVLGSWAIGGMLLSVLGHFRSQPAMHIAESELEPAV